MVAFVHCRDIEKKILTGETNHPESLRMIHFGSKVQSGAVYLCQTCKEFMNHEALYLMDNLSISPYGTVRYNVKYLSDIPECPTCGRKLEFIKNIRSSNIKCPKCGGGLKSRIAGYFD